MENFDVIWLGPLVGSVHSDVTHSMKAKAKIEAAYCVHCQRSMNSDSRK